jgi:Zn finger protein HypA/HybF involved in hydrogenase expression
VVHINLWVPKELIEEAKKKQINLSELFREALTKKLREMGTEVKLPEPSLVIKVECIYCKNLFETTSIKIVRCPRCQKYFRVYTKRYGSRIKGIVKGSEADLMKAYNRMYYRIYQKGNIR